MFSLPHCTVALEAAVQSAHAEEWVVNFPTSLGQISALKGSDGLTSGHERSLGDTTLFDIRIYSMELPVGDTFGGWRGKGLTSLCSLVRMLCLRSGKLRGQNYNSVWA